MDVLILLLPLALLWFLVLRPAYETCVPVAMIKAQSELCASNSSRNA